MADVYIRNPETKQIICASFSENEFDDILTCSRLIGTVSMELFDEKTGIMEYHLL